MRSPNESDVAAERMATAIKNWVSKEAKKVTRTHSELAYLTALEVANSHVRHAHYKIVANRENASHLGDAELELEQEIVELLGKAQAKVTELKERAE